MKVPFFSPSFSRDTYSKVDDVLHSGWITTGKYAKIFEEKFASLFSKNIYSISVNSATAGLHLSLEALGIKKGDQVITSTITFTATAEVIRYLGATPVLVDINPNDYCLDIDKVKAAINEKTKAIIPVHFAGHSADLSNLIPLAKSHNIAIVEDAAHCLQTYHKNKLIGSFDTSATVFSFYANKNITTGEGGMILTSSKKIADRICVMRNHGMDRSAFNRFISNKPAWDYDVIAAGYKYNLTDIAASIGICQLDDLPKFTKIRKSIAFRYDNELKNLPIILPPRTNLKEHSWHLYIIQLFKEFNRNDLVDYLFSKGIGTSIHYKPLHLHTYWSKFLDTNASFEKAEAYFDSCISLPIYPSLSEKQLNYVISEIKNFFEINRS